MSVTFRTQDENNEMIDLFTIINNLHRQDKFASSTMWRLMVYDMPTSRLPDLDVRWFVKRYLELKDKNSCTTWVSDVNGK